MTTLLSKSVNAPVKGILLVWGTMAAAQDIDDPDPARLSVRVVVDGAAATVTNSAWLDQNSAAAQEATIAVSGAIQVNAGTRNVALQANEAGAGMAYVASKSITTLFVPFGNTGQVGALAATELATASSTEPVQQQPTGE